MQRRKILVTGTNPEKYRDRGKIVHHPMIGLKAAAFPSVDIACYDWLIFTSRFGVRCFLKRLSRVSSQHFRSLRVCVIGKATAKALEEFGVKACVVPQKESSKGIVEAMRKFKLRGKRILIPRSNLSIDYLPGELKKMGASVDTIVVYRNVRPKTKKIDLSQIDEIVFTSPSTVRNFISVYKKVPKRIKVSFIGGVTANEFSKS
jgi:uroporphyrinogen III methyltransferase/synthase